MFNSMGNGGFGLDIGALLGNMMGRNGNNGDWGMNGAWWVIIFLVILCGGWGENGLFGNRGSNNSNGGGNVSYVPYMMNGVWANGALTRADLCQDMNFQEVQNGVRSISDSVNTGFANLNSTICNQQYDTARMMNGLENVVMNGFNSSNVVALQNQNALQTQLAQCCCDQKSLFAQAEYNRAADTCAITTAIQNAARDIIQNDNCNYRQLHDEQIALQMQAKDAQISALQGALSKCDTQNIVTAAVTSAVNQIRPTPEPSYIVPNPWGCNCGNGFGFGYGC